MPQFEHYMYVLECADGSLYAGYATDVDRRVATHQAGKGAKYTKARLPVRLLAKARFYSKERAMSAEARFKRLSRGEKERLLGMAAESSFKEALKSGLPGFGEEPALEFVDRLISENVDEGYRDFQSKLMPTVGPETFAGVRTPALRKIAKQLRKRDDARDFMRALPHRLFDESQIHAFAIGLERDYDAAVDELDRFLPFVDNWATCDQLSAKVLASQPEQTLQKARKWMASPHCYTIRFGIGVLMRLYLDDLFQPELLALVAATRMPSTAGDPASDSDVYYVDMMRAWYFAEALVRQEEAALPYFEQVGDAAFLDEWTRRKAIQKAIESLRVPDELKGHLRTLR